jgi:hypothetical protein
MKTNTAASPVRNSHPQDIFTADLSVFQAHLPCCHDSIYHVMRSLWFVIVVPGAEKRRPYSAGSQLYDDNSLDRGGMSCDRHCGCRLTDVSVRDFAGW